MTAEDARYNVRRFLASCPQSAPNADSICHGLRRWGESITTEEAQIAALFLADLTPPQVKIHTAGLGSSKTYQITSHGLLAFERNE